MCDTDFNSQEVLSLHYSDKHVYCKLCQDFLTDEDALQKHNLREHVDSMIVDKTEDPAESVDIKEELSSLTMEFEC